MQSTKDVINSANKVDMFNFIKKLFRKKLKGKFLLLEKFLPDNFDAPVYLLGYVEGKGFRVIELPYRQRKDL